MSLASFVFRYLPPPPARVLEIGCGPVGDLTYEIATAGYDVVAVDPVAPEGPLFRRIPFEDFDEPGKYDAVVASLSMHHLADLTRTAERIVELLVPGGTFILEEWDRDRLRDEATARWYFHQRHAALVTGSQHGDTFPARFEDWHSSWLAVQGHMHDYAAMRAQLMAPFQERFFAWRPYLYRYGLHEDVEPLERTLIEEGAIQATGFRWVGKLDSAG